MSTRSLRRERCAGVATIEFAICAPLLLLLMLATAEIGRFLYQYNTLTKSVRDGVRFAVNEAAVGTTRVVNLTPLVLTQTRNLVATGTITGTGSPLLPGLATQDVEVTNDANGFVSVSADYTFVDGFLVALRPIATDSVTLGAFRSSSLLGKTLTNC